VSAFVSQKIFAWTAAMVDPVKKFI